MRIAKPLLALSLSIAVTAQQPSVPPQSIPKFTSRTELVTVPVVVMRHASAMRQLQLAGWLDEHVTGLTKDDFAIDEDGKPKPIASFEEIRDSAPSMKTLKAFKPPPGVYTNEVASDGPVTMVVFLLDLMNTPYLYQEGAKKRLLQYLQTDYRPDRPTMLAALHPDGLRILHDFTTDPEVLAAAVRRLKNNVEHDPALDNQVQTELSGAIGQQIDVRQEYDAVAAEFMGGGVGHSAYEQRIQNGRLESTFQELQQLAHALSAVRGMKSLVWATGGIALPYTMDSRDHRLVEQYVQTLQLLSAAGVAVYPIDTVLDTDNPGFSSPQSRYPDPRAAVLPLRNSALQKLQNFMQISQRTGGSYCLLRKDPDFCFRRAVDYNSQYYMLSYYTQSDEKARWREIHVKVRGEGLQVRARGGYFSSGTNGDPDERRKRDIVQAFTTPAEYRGLPIGMRWADSGDRTATEATGTAAPGVELQLAQRRPKRPFLLSIASDALTVDTADNNHLQLDIVALALGSDGKVLADLTQQLNLHPSATDLVKLRSTGFVYSNAIEVPPHTAKVRFIVRDDLSERMGTVSAPIAAQ